MSSLVPPQSSVIPLNECNTAQHLEFCYFKRLGDYVTFPIHYYPILKLTCDTKCIEIITGSSDTNIDYPEGMCMVHISYLDEEFPENTLRRLQVEAYNIEYWIEEIKHLTFPTIMVGLTEPEIESIIQVGDLCQHREFENRDRSELLSIYDKLDRVLDPGNKFYFLKLNSVSPKDMRRSLGCRNQTYLYYRSLNIGRGEFKNLCVSSSEEILVTLCSSTRTVYKLKYRQAPVYIALREWEILPEQLEFRCFVHDYKLRAVSQYFWETVIPELQIPDNQLKELLDSINQYYIQYKNTIPYSDAVMDLVITNSVDNDISNPKFQIIEFNSFGSNLNSGSALFNWKLDREQLYNGETPVLRILRPNEIVHEI